MSARRCLGGTFKVKDRIVAVVSGDILDTLWLRFDGRVPSGLAAVSCSVLAAGFDAKRMIAKIERYPEMVERCRTLDQYVDMLEATYNRNFRGERYPLKHHADKAARSRNAALRQKCR
jgi:hypothetical protein